MKKVTLTALFISNLLCSFANTVTISSVTALQTASNNAMAGDTLVLANGTYLNNVLNITKSNITIRAATAGGVFLNGTNAISIQANYVTFSGFQFTSGSIGSAYIIQVYGSHNILTQLNFNGYLAKKYIEVKAGTQYNEISYCNIEHKPDTSISGAVLGCAIQINTSPTIPGYHKIRYCSFKNFPGLGGDYGNEPIRLGLSTEATNNSRTIIEYCYFNNTGLGDGENISVKCCENVIRYCTFTNNPEGMLVFRNGNRNVAYGNFFINGAGGIRVKEANDIYCYNNYFENSGTTGSTNTIAFNYISPNLNNINFFYNTFVDCGDIDLGGTGPVNVTFANNIFKKSSGNIFSSPNTGTSWKGNIYSGTPGISISTGMTNINPQLVLNTDNYYGLSSASPAINSSATTFPSILDIANIDDDPQLLLDISRQTRPTAIGSKDVGCDEYTTGTISNRPLTLQDVGPSYLASGCALPATPASFSIVSGSCNSVNLTWNPVSGNGITYQVMKNNSSCSAAFTTAATGYLTTTSATISLSPGTTYYFVVVAKNTCGNSLNSNCVSFTSPSLVTPAISITANPAGSVCAGINVTFTPLPSNGGSSPVYKWKKNGVNISTGATFSSSTLANGNVISCVMTSNAACVSSSVATSNNVTVTVNNLPSATVSPSGAQTMCSGQSIVLNASTSTGQTYQWQKNNVNISGATKTNYTVTTAGSYRLRVTNASGCSSYSSATSVTINCKSSDSIADEIYDAVYHSNINVFPNPSGTEFNILLSPDNDIPVSVIVTDIMGGIVYKEEVFHREDIHFGEGFGDGMYFAHVISGSRERIIKIIKTK